MNWPNCNEQFELNEATTNRWVSVWGGKVKCPRCSTWIHKSRYSLALTNGAALAAMVIGLGALSSIQDLGVLFAVGLVVTFILIRVSRMQKWVAFESGNDT